MIFTSDIVYHMLAHIKYADEGRRKSAYCACGWRSPYVGQETVAYGFLIDHRNHLREFSRRHFQPIQ